MTEEHEARPVVPSTCADGVRPRPPSGPASGPPVATPPPTEPPPAPGIISSITWTDRPDERLDGAAEIRSGALWLRGTGPSSIAGHVAYPHPLRDAVVDTVVRLHGLADDEGFGVFVRQNQPSRYVGLRVTPGRVMAISAYDGMEQPIAVGSLAPGMVLHPDENRVTVACVGPSITLSLNGLVATSVLVDARYVDGFCGVLLEQRHDTTPELEVRWMQLREVW